MSEDLDKSTLEQLESLRVELEQAIKEKMSEIIKAAKQRGLAKYDKYTLRLKTRDGLKEVTIAKDYLKVDNVYLVSSFYTSSAKALIEAVDILASVVEHINEKAKEEKAELKAALDKLKTVRVSGYVRKG